MYKLILCAGLLALSFTSCKKEEDKPTTYRLSGLSDLVLTRNPFGKNPVSLPSQLAFEVKSLQGEPQKVMLSVAGLPAGLTDSFSVKSSVPDFSTSLFLTDKGAAAGEYMPVLKLQTQTTGEAKSYPFKVTLRGYGSCAGYFANRAFEADYFPSNNNPGHFKFKASSLLQNENRDTVLIKNFKNSGEDLKVVFDCQKFTFVVPEQDIGNRIVRGTGSGLLFNEDSETPNVINFGIQELDQNNVQSSYSLRYKFE